MDNLVESSLGVHPSLVVGEEAVVLTWAGGDPRPVQEAELPDYALPLAPPPQPVPVHVDGRRLQQGQLGLKNLMRSLRLNGCIVAIIMQTE